MSNVFTVYECGECGEVYESWHAADKCCPLPPEEPVAEAIADEAAAAEYANYIFALEAMFGQRRLFT